MLVRSQLAFAAASALACLLPSAAEAGEPTESRIVGGSVTEECGWPTVLATAGCTATLIHPEAISTAQHCGQPSSVHFGETSSGGGFDVPVTSCVSTGSPDAMICQLAAPVTGLPVTPIAFGCEMGELVTPGAPVVVAGFGNTFFNAGDYGTKRWIPQVLTSLEAERVIIGNPGDPTSPCSGDSGGPAFVQAPDGGWRVIGTLLGGTTSTPCNSAAQYMRLDLVVPAFESQTGIDITPCFDGQTGAWDPGPECTGFFAGDHTAGGSWASGCLDAPASGPSETCGAGIGDGDGDGDETGGETGDGGTSGGNGGTGGAEATDGGATGTGDGGDATADGGMDGTEGSGCACGVAATPDRSPAPLFALFALLRLRRGGLRRRSGR
jgi:uncharacterized membrane protein YgcG